MDTYICCPHLICPGLSHYLEHMLFMGSEKYPKEDDYDAFLTRHGGSSNAYTDVGEDGDLI